jgi:hypothetical protein
MENPERFTGYSGPSAAKVWDAIYNENCFNVAHKMQLAADCEQCSLDREADAEDLAETVQAAALSGISYAQNPLSLGGAGLHGHQHQHQEKQQKSEQEQGAGANTSPFIDTAMNAMTSGSATAVQDEEMCLEKRVFYRMISGLHASISIHICDEYFNQTSGIWVSSRAKQYFFSDRRWRRLTSILSILVKNSRARTWNVSCRGWGHTRTDWRTSFSTTLFWFAPSPSFQDTFATMNSAPATPKKTPKSRLVKSSALYAADIGSQEMVCP